jgi:hypothetical protein
VAMKVYSEEFKADAVALYVSDPGSTYASVAKDWALTARRCGCGSSRPAKPGPVSIGGIGGGVTSSGVVTSAPWLSPGTGCAW